MRNAFSTEAFVYIGLQMLTKLLNELALVRFPFRSVRAPRGFYQTSTHKHSPTSNLEFMTARVCRAAVQRPLPR